MEIESRLLPCGLHVVGSPPTAMEAIATLVNIAEIDRPEGDPPVKGLPGILARSINRNMEEIYLNNNRVCSDLARKELTLKVWFLFVSVLCFSSYGLCCCFFCFALCREPPLCPLFKALKKAVVLSPLFVCVVCEWQQMITFSVTLRKMSG